MQANSEILENIDKARKKQKNLTFFELINAYLIAGVIFFITLPTIYIRNEIYYLSRDIGDLHIKHDVLMEENGALKNKLEFLRYKHEILDPFKLKNVLPKDEILPEKFSQKGKTVVKTDAKSKKQ